MKRIILLLAVAFAVVSCQQAVKETDLTAETIEISQLVSEPMAFENQTVRFEGIISHVCRHSGDKMRIIQTDNDSFSILVLLGENASEFSAEMEGQEVVIFGILKAEPLAVMVADHVYDHDHEHEDGHECSSTEEAVQKLKEKGVDPNFRTYVEIIGWEVK
jgi:hypothetical protein